MNVARTLLAAALVFSFAPMVPAQDAQTDAQTDKPPATQPASVVDFRKLKEQLPETLGGIKRTQASGERTSFGEIKLSQAHGTYVKDKEDGDSPRIEMQIMDYGANKDAAAAIAFWTQLEIDQEGDDGFQRSLKIQNYPAMQQYTNDGKSGTLQIMVADRFHVNVTTHGLSAEEFKKIGDELKLKELAALK